MFFSKCASSAALAALPGHLVRTRPSKPFPPSCCPAEQQSWQWLGSNGLASTQLSFGRGLATVLEDSCRPRGSPHQPLLHWSANWLGAAWGAKKVVTRLTPTARSGAEDFEQRNNGLVSYLSQTASLCIAIPDKPDVRSHCRGQANIAGRCDAEDSDHCSAATA